MTPERLWYQRQGHRQFVCEGSVVVVRLPGLWGLALQLLASTLCNMFPKVVRSRRVLSMWQRRQQDAQTLNILAWHQDSSHCSLLLVSYSRRPAYLLDQALSGHLALASTW